MYLIVYNAVPTGTVSAAGPVSVSFSSLFHPVSVSCVPTAPIAIVNTLFYLLPTILFAINAVVYVRRVHSRGGGMDASTSRTGSSVARTGSDNSSSRRPGGRTPKSLESPDQSVQSRSDTSSSRRSDQSGSDAGHIGSGDVEFAMQMQLHTVDAGPEDGPEHDAEQRHDDGMSHHQALPMTPFVRHPVQDMVQSGAAVDLAELLPSAAVPRSDAS